MVVVGEVTDTRNPELGDIFYYDSSFSDSSIWPGIYTSSESV